MSTDITTAATAVSLVESIRAGNSATSSELADAFIALYPSGSIARDAIVSARETSLIAWIKDEIDGIDYWYDAAWRLFALAFFATASFAKAGISLDMLSALISFEHSPYVVPTERQIDALPAMISKIQSTGKSTSTDSSFADRIAVLANEASVKIEKIRAKLGGGSNQVEYAVQLRFFERLMELLLSTK